MENISLSVLFGALFFLILLSAFFSASETAMMSLNRYRLRHLQQAKHATAIRVGRLLEKPDRLIGLILLGNNFVNILASSIATIIALRLIGENGVAVAAGLLTLVVLIFAEVAPKTLAILHPQRVAFPSAYLLSPMLKVAYPLVWTINILANSLLRLVGVSPQNEHRHQLSSDELRTVVNEAAAMIPRRHKQMLVNILDLEKVTVEDIMVPRNEIVGLDLDDDIEQIIEQLRVGQHTRLPVYHGNIDDVIGFVHVRNLLHLVGLGNLTREAIEEISREVYFVPEGTPLNTQLLNFQRRKSRIGLVVNEYGDILGLVTLEDILEEIVGEFTTDASATLTEVHPQGDGSYVVDGSVNIRALNRMMHWRLPTHGPKTLNGLILEHLESIPPAGTSLLVAGHPIEIMQTTGSAVKIIRIRPPLKHND